MYFSCFLLCNAVYAQKEKTQKIAVVDSISIARTDNVIEKILGVESKNITCLVFSIDDKILFIHKSSDVYKLYTFEEIFNYDIQENELQREEYHEVKKNKILDKIFSTPICDKQFIYSETDSLIKRYAHWDTRYIYFMVRKNGKKACEFNLPILYKVDVSDEEFIPIEEDVFNYLMKKLMGKPSKR